jgi:hypothetical protein
VANLVARLLAAAGFWVQIQTSLKIGRHQQRSGQHTLARQKISKKNSPDYILSYGYALPWALPRGEEFSKLFYRK